MKFNSEFEESIFKKKYLHEGEKTVDEAIETVDKALSKYEPSLKGKISELIDKKFFVPAGGVWRAAGSKSHKVSFANCTTLDNLDDNLESIFDRLYKWAKIAAYGQGEGIDLSNLRPLNAIVHNSSKQSSGGISFIAMFDAVLGVIAQQGRRGASLISIHDDYPNFEEFCTYKLNPKNSTSANLSIQISDAFMEAAVKDKKWTLKWKGEFSDVSVEKSAKELFKLFCTTNWKSGEPGALFMDTIRKYSNSDYIGYPVVGCNACSEILLDPYNLCILSSINLAKYHEFKHEFEELIEFGTLFLNAVLKAELKENRSPIPEQRQKLKELPRIGLGVTGMADMFINEKIVYGSDKSVTEAKRIFQTMASISYKTSNKIALRDGSFKAYNKKNYMKSPYVQRLLDSNLITEKDLKAQAHVCKLCVAPTGCQSPDTLIISNMGILRLGEVINTEGDKWQNLNNFKVAQELKEEAALKGFVNGITETKKIKLKSGVILEGTLNHKYRIFNFENKEYLWKKIEDLVVGDYLAYRIGGYEKETDFEFNNNNLIQLKVKSSIIFPEKLNEEVGEFLGIYYANGSTHTRSLRIHYDRKKIDRINRVCELVKSIFNITAKIEKARTCTAVNINSTELLVFLNLYGLIKPKSKDNNIPFCIRVSSKKTLQKFIDGYWYGDGSHNKSSHYIDTASFRMAQDLAVCYRALGLNSTIYEDTKRQGAYCKNIMYRIRIGLYGSVNFDITHTNKVLKNTREKKEFCNSVSPEMFFDMITQIETSKNMTLDLEVPEKNTYISNSYISHNTASIVVGCGGTGIEPIYSKYYVRRERATTGDFKEWFMFNPAVQTHLQNQGLEVNKENVEKLTEDYWVTAHSVNPIVKINLISEIQKWVDQGISITQNLPESATVEDVQNIYEVAWKAELKGVSVYREGSRDGILITEANYNKSKKHKKRIIEKRPKQLLGTVFKEGKYTAIIGFKDEVPYEIFGGAVENSFEDGFIVNMGKSQYELNGINILSVFNNKATNIITRFISLSLRHEIHLQFIIEQLEKETEFFDVTRFFMRCLKKYLTNEAALSNHVCAACGSELLQYVGGCLTCLACGNSKCS